MLKHIHRKIKYEYPLMTDIAGHYVANVIVGTLEIDSLGKIFLLTQKFLIKLTTLQ
jgi:hypothetical protein